MNRLATLLVTMFALTLTGCSNSSPKQDAQDTTAAEMDWLIRMTAIENQYTERTYQCMTEMYSLAYRPVESGPLCRDSCELLKQVNTMAHEAPAYIHNPQQYALGESEVCNHKAKTKKKGDRS